MNERLLAIYLQDHLAGATAGLELARRSAGANAGTPYGPFLERLRDEIVEDRQSLVEIMERFGIGADRLKNAGAWTLEKAGRLKLNGSWTSYSPLSRVIELDGLTTGVRVKLSLWENLRVVASGEPHLAEAELDRLVERAQSQLEGLGQERARASREAFIGT